MYNLEIYSAYRFPFFLVKIKKLFYNNCGDNMKRQIILVICFLILISGIYYGYNRFINKNELSPIDKVIMSYKSYKFRDLENDDNLFELKKYTVKYDMTKESSVIKLNDKSISAYLIDDILHIMMDDIDYKYPDLGEVDRLMFYKWCNCNNNCYKLIILTEEGKVYYLDLNDSIDFEDPSVFKLLESDMSYKNIGYVENLNIDSDCNINGLVLTDEYDNEIIYDNNLEIFEQSYYTFLKNDDHILYVYPEGYISLDNHNKIDLRFKEIMVSNESFYLIGVDSKLYVIDYNNNLKKKSNKVVSKIGSNKGESIIIYSDATAIKINVKSVLK